MNERSNALHRLNVEAMLHPVTDARAHEASGPVIVDRGEGVRLWDTEGREYIDGLAGLWSVALGYGERRLRDAAMVQMDRLPFYHTFSSKSHAPAIRLAAKLVEMAPEGLDRVFFTSSGSEAIDTVIKMIWYRNNALGRPEKKKFLARDRAYHGVTVAAASLTGLPANHRDFDLPAIPVIRLTCPHHYRQAHEGEDEAAFAARLVAEAEEVIEREGSETIAAFVGEPLMGAGGVMPPPDGYWQGIEALCRRHDILLVADEVINGFGRLGTMWGSQAYGFRPDVMTVSKQLTSSYLPLAAVLFGPAVYEPIADNSHQIGTFGHGYTASGHPAAAAVALENLAIIEERDLVRRAAGLAVPFQAGLAVLGDRAHVGEVRGRGLIAGVELMADRGTRRAFEPASKVGARAAEIAQDEGLILHAIGDTLALCPPLVVVEDDVAEICARMERVVDRTETFIAAERPS